MRIVCGGHSWQLGSIASLARETTRGEILVAVWPKHGLRSDLKSAYFRKFSWGGLPPDPPSLYTLKAYAHPSSQWPYQS